jgi:methyl-accepting chemotaxis protein
MFLLRLKISHKILAVIIAGIIMSASFAGIAIIMGQKQTDTLKEIHFENVTPLNNLRKIQLLFRELEFRMVGVQAEVTTPTAAGNHLEDSLKEIEVLWSGVKNGLTENEEKEKFEKGFRGFNAIAPQLKEAYFNEETDNVEEIYDEWLDYKPLIMKSINKFADILTENVEHNYLDNQRVIKKVNTFIAVTSISVISFFIVIALFIIRSINRPINTVVTAAGQIAEGDLTQAINIKSRDEMGSMATSLNSMIENLRDAFRRIVNTVEKMSSDTEGLSGLSKKLLEGAKQQRTIVEQVAVSSTEMSQTILEVSKNSTETSNATKDSFDTAKTGKEIVSETVQSITMLAESVAEASNTIGGLGENLDEIGAIVSVIQDIADQTNLLALNAAIEAARSGEHGRGFAVVADEVRKLAERTAKATDEIASQIKAIQNESKASIAAMEKGKTLAEESVNTATKAGDALQGIVESSDKVMDMVRRVATATEEQSAASEEVSQTMEHITETINEHFNLAGEVEKSASNLSVLGQEVIELTSHFKTGDGDSIPANKIHDRKPDETAYLNKTAQ